MSGSGCVVRSEAPEHSMQWLQEEGSGCVVNVVMSDYRSEAPEHSMQWLQEEGSGCVVNVVMSDYRSEAPEHSMQWLQEEGPSGAAVEVCQVS